METLVTEEANKTFWINKRVFVTGHTGFKGAWLCAWLNMLDAKVFGYALDPPTVPSLFNVTDLGAQIVSTIGDVRDLTKLTKEIQEVQPDVVLHLAAQPLVRESYKSPVDTYVTNVMGSVNLFEAIRNCPSIKAVVNVTTDKCYENREWPWGYREIEPMGGFDPYSSSKACSELVTSAYRQSFLRDNGVALASARAGNVIGGGDWADDRLLPDILRALDAGEMLNIRNPHAIRPWQHVLEPLSGYLLLAQRLYEQGGAFAEPWNFGPSDEDARSVSWILKHLKEIRSDLKWFSEEENRLHEASFLKLDSSKAKNMLGWKPRWSLSTALEKTLSWHEAWSTGSDMAEFTANQIKEYEDCAEDE